MNVNDQYHYRVTENMTIVSTTALLTGFMVSLFSSWVILYTLLIATGIVLQIIESVYMLTYLRHIKIRKGSVSISSTIKLVSYLNLLAIIIFAPSIVGAAILFYPSFFGIFLSIYLEGSPSKYNGWKI